MEPSEKSEIENANFYVFLINRSSFGMNKIDVEFQQDFISNSYDFVYTVYSHGHTQTFTNMHTRIRGIIFRNSYMSTSVYAENITIDASYTKGGFVYGSGWNFQGAQNLANIEFRNILAFSSEVNYVENGLIRNTGNANMTIYNLTSSVYSSFTNFLPIVAFLPTSACNPQDDVLQFIKFDMIKSLGWSSSIGNSIAYFYMTSPPVSTRKYQFYFQNSIFEGIKQQTSLLIIGGRGLDEAYFFNNTIRNTTLSGRGISFNGMKYWLLYNTTVENNQFTGTKILNILNIKILEVQGLYFDGHSTSTNKIGWLKFAGTNGNMTVTDLVISNLQSYRTAAVEFTGSIEMLTLGNVKVENATVDSNAQIIYIETAKNMLLYDLKFINVSSHNEESVENYMMTLSSVNLAGKGTLIIQDVDVSLPQIGFFNILNIKGTPTVNRQLALKNISIHDANIKDMISFIFLDEIYSEQEFEIIFSDCHFSNLNLYQGSKLYNFKHALKNPVRVVNNTFKNLNYGEISLKSFTTTDKVAAKVVLENITAEYINSGFGSLIKMEEKSHLTVLSSKFNNIFWFEEGSVIYIGSPLTETEIYDTQFYNNSALTGGVIYVQEESSVLCQNWTFFNNFGIEGGVIATADNGFFAIKDSLIFNNFAISGSVTNIYNSAKESVLSGTTFYNNFYLSSDEVLSEISGGWAQLWFLSSKFKEYLTQNSAFLGVKKSQYLIKSAIGNIKISECQVSNQGEFLDAFSSTIKMENTIISNFELSSVLVKFSLSHLEANNVNISSVSSLNNYEPYLFSGSTESSVNITEITYQNGTGSLLNFNSVSGNVSDLTVSDVQSPSEIIHFTKSNNLVLININIRNATSLKGVAFSIEQTSIQGFKNVKMSDIGHLALLIFQSNLKDIDQLVIANVSQGMKIYDQSEVFIKNSTFENLGHVNIEFGGSIYSKNSNTSISTVSFLNSSAKKGGALALICDKKLKWSYSVTNSNFISNIAEVQGGGIYYNLYRPYFENNRFENNSANYGKNIASYPTKIKFTNSSTDIMKLKNVVSGHNNSPSIQFSLVDHDGQIISIDTTSKVKIKSVFSNSSVAGTNEAIVKSGIAVFSNLKLISKPGSKNVKFEVHSAAIDDEVIQLQHNGTLKQEYLDANFRIWESGEIEYDNQWVVCSSETYSLGVNKTKWEKCMLNAVWLGGKEISVRSGYFRASHESSSIIECPRKGSCKGEYSEDSEFPVKCAHGYEGLLWAECQNSSSQKYERSSSFGWSKCPNLTLNIIRLVGIMLIILIFLTILIVMSVKKKTESNKSTLMRILTNYLQVISSALAFGSNFPDVIHKIFIPADKIGSTSETFVSFDWFLQDSELKAFTPSHKMFQLFLTLFLPIAMILLYSILSLIMYFIARKWFPDIKRSIVVSSVVILFLLHPTLARTGFSIFQWIEVDSGDYRVKVDFDIKWYSKKHIIWWCILGLPSLIIWGAGIPIVALVILLKYRNRLDKWEIQKYYWVLYQGLRLDRFYWELINTCRKLTLLWLSIFLVQYSFNFGVIVSVSCKNSHL
jgi:hypothetical protein